MEYVLVNNLLDSAVKTIPGLGIFSDFAVNWYEQKILFCGEVIASYELIDYDNKYTEKVNHDAMRNDYDAYSKTYEKISNSQLRAIIITSEYGEDVSVFLDQKDSVIYEQIQKAVIYYREAALRINLDLCHSYMSALRQQHEWSAKVGPSISKVKQLIREYESACMEPDGNVMAECVRSINGQFKEIEKLYTNTWGK